MQPAIDAQLTLRLEPALDFKAASALRDSFLDRRGEALRIDASQVSQLGGLCLQVLMAARRAWQSDCLDFQFAQRSAEFDAAVELFGANEELGLHEAKDC